MKDIQYMKRLIAYYILRVSDHKSAERVLKRIVKTAQRLSNNNEAAVAGDNIYAAWGDFIIDDIPCGYFVWNTVEVWFGNEDIFLKLGLDDEKSGYFWNGLVVEWKLEKTK